jgi:N-acetylglucosaminyldiphosphoundecaprenol N-acetyl-beta-D-mannosaminyltransferase
MATVAEPWSARERVAVAGTQVDPLSPQLLLDVVHQALVTNTKARVIFCNVSTVVACQDNPELRSAVGRAEVISPDGMPVVWVARLQGDRTIQRVAGPTFMPSAMEHGMALGWRHYFYGGSPETLARLVASFRERYPAAEIVGSHAPPFRDLTPHEVEQDIDRINAAKPDLVWVGLGMPKQEIWMARHQDRLTAPVLLGVGAAFDFNAGTIKRAPVWMQRYGLEWTHRLLQEPRRLWRRYFLGNSRFFILVGRDIVRQPRRYLRGLA